MINERYGYVPPTPVSWGFRRLADHGRYDYEIVVILRDLLMKRLDGHEHGASAPG